ncbi:hypothetical protein HPP92_025377 [Vanilla planifolia]|uniref:Uncharacterized protein n=1 Tax=Vanilla planifolia TaxID=51239 RepID=A0A835PHG0_VANPL|nr:hypothetical protein HPP92_025377 [Vanilla planifolia]
MKSGFATDGRRANAKSEARSQKLEVNKSMEASGTHISGYLQGGKLPSKVVVSSCALLTKEMVQQKQSCDGIDGFHLVLGVTISCPEKHVLSILGSC